MTERVTLEVNGERITVDVPDGTPDSEIIAYVSGGAAPAEKQPKPTGNVAPQALGIARQLAPVVPEGMRAAGEGIKSAAQFVANRPITKTIADIGGIMHTGVPYGMAKDAIFGAGPTIGEAANAVKSGLGKVASGVGRVGGAVARGLVAPESAFLMPYQMAAYEQEKIRQNPNAPGLEFNPYAQTVRGEYATQGQAGAANARRAVINAPYGNVTPEERRLLDEDRKRKMQMTIQMEAARRVLK
jgi:hypothetical protein